MSSRDSATPTLNKSLTIDVRSRRSERRVGVLALLGVAVAIALLPLSPAIAAFLCLLASGVVLAGLWSHGWLGGAERLTAVSWSFDGRWMLSSAARKNIPGTLSDDSRIGRRWLWLRWHTGGADRPRHRSMLLLKGDVLPAEFRRLGVRLRLESVSRSDRAGA